MPSIESPLHKILKSHREQKRFSLHSIHQETRIPVIYLEAMEAGNWKAFPAEVYLLGFLQKYAKYLGLDPKEMVQIYRREQEAQNMATQEEVKKVEQVAHREQSNTFVKGLVFAVLVLFVGVWWLYTVIEPSSAKKRKSAPERAASAVVSEAAPDESSKLSLAVRARESVWVRIVSDQALQFEGFLPAGTTRQYVAAQDLMLRIGNVYALELTLNERKINPSVGSVQSVGELHLTPESLKDDSILFKTAGSTHTQTESHIRHDPARRRDQVSQNSETPIGPAGHPSGRQKN